MDKLIVADLTKIVEIMTDVIIANEVPFCELDSHAGDGDFGMSLAKGFKEVRKAWDELPRDEIGGFLKAAGMIITEHCGGASGPIWGSAFRAAGKSAAGKDIKAALAEGAKAAVDGAGATALGVIFTAVAKGL